MQSFISKFRCVWRRRQTVPTLATHLTCCLVAAAFWLPAETARAQSRPRADGFRGLWVGQVTLNYVNEVTVPLDENNVPVAPNPNVPTPTADQAQLRLILHVNGAGQVSLLKDVAVLNRVWQPDDASSSGGVNLKTNSAVLDSSRLLLNSESDLALVSDERLYGQFPPQPATRIASVVFDFGDSRATEAVEAVMDGVADAVTNSVATSTEDLNDTQGRLNAEGTARTAAGVAATPLVANADVASAFSAFLASTSANRAAVEAIATAMDPATAAQASRTAALALQNNSFYQDSRGVEMIDAIVAALGSAGPDPETRRQVARNIAASYADVSDQYQRFIAGKLFGDMITAAAEAASMEATNLTATVGSVSNAVTGAVTVNDARQKALLIQVAAYDDNRASEAIKSVLATVVESAGTFLGATGLVQQAVATAAEQAGRDALSTNVPRYEVSADVPTPDYDTFIRSDDFQGSATLAAQAAAEGAVAERKNNPLYTPDSLRDAAKAAAATVLRNVLSAAARAVRTELPLVGTFGPGSGDPRLTWNIKENNEPSLGAAGLTGTIILPANHPTNPFRHRRHPDHTVGFDIARHLRLDFNGQSGDPLARAGFGVERVTGVYREEVFGLHKPLGPDPVNAPIGLKVEGTFELNRISLIDALNAL